MYKVHQLLIILSLLLTLINSAKISSCILNTPCKCLLTDYSFTLINCSYSLPNLPVVHSNISINITRIIARNALIRWPTHLCNYSNTEILDFSGSYFHLQFLDLSCLYQLIHLNLSRTQLKSVPKNIQKKLQILDLSNNQIENLDGNSFRLLNNLNQLYLENNPLKQINHFEYLLSLSHLQFLNLKSSNPFTTIKKSLTINQWINLAYKWKNRNRTLIIRTNTISFQSIFPSNSNQFKLISLDVMKIIFQTLANSTFTTSVSTPKCNCTDLRNYQRVFSLINNDENQWPLFQTSTCLMPNGIIHARLFDHRTLMDLHCVILEKNISDSCSVLDYHLFIYLLLLFYLFY